MDKGERQLPATLNAYSGFLHMHTELLPSPFFHLDLPWGTRHLISPEKIQ